MIGELHATKYGGQLAELINFKISPAGQLFDEDTGALLYDEVTGAPITA